MNTSNVALKLCDVLDYLNALLDHMPSQGPWVTSREAEAVVLVRDLTLRIQAHHAHVSQQGLPQVVLQEAR